MAALSRRAITLLKISFLTIFAEAMLVPIYSTFTERLGGSILDAGIAFAVFSMATGVIVVVIGTRPWFEAHVRRLLILGFVLSAACDVSYIFVQTKWQLFATQMVLGLATGLIEPAWDSLFTEQIESESAKHWSIWAGGSHFVTGLAAIVGGLIVAFSSFTALFVAMGLVDAVAAWIAWRSSAPAAQLPVAAPIALPSTKAVPVNPSRAASGEDA